jgi:hypothetical protein
VQQVPIADHGLDGNALLIEHPSKVLFVFGQSELRLQAFLAVADSQGTWAKERVGGGGGGGCEPERKCVRG